MWSTEEDRQKAYERAYGQPPTVDNVTTKQELGSRLHRLEVWEKHHAPSQAINAVLGALAKTGLEAL